MAFQVKTGAHTKGRNLAPRKVIHVDEAECEKGGLHELENKMQGRNWLVTYCVKCKQTSSDLDMELNGERT